MSSTLQRFTVRYQVAWKDHCFTIHEVVIPARSEAAAMASAEKRATLNYVKANSNFRLGKFWIATPRGTDKVRKDSEKVVSVHHVHGVVPRRQRRYR